MQNKTFRTAKKHERRPLQSLCTVRVLTAGLVLALSIAAAARATTYYLDAVNGSDRNPGTTDRPWKTLNRAYTWWGGEGPKVKEGDTVIVRSGGYGQFTESTGVNPGEDWLFYRNDWITYRADSGHTPTLSKVCISNQDKWGDIKHGRSYLILDGFRILDGVAINYTSYVHIHNCNITATPESYEGLYAPYYRQGAYGLIATAAHHITIQDNEISNAFRGISLGGGSSNCLIRNNRIHRIAEDGISAPASQLVIEDNTIYDIDERRTPVGIWGTRTGSFLIGEIVSQKGTGAEGIVCTIPRVNAIGVFQTNAKKFDRESRGGRTITGRASGAALSGVDKDYAHTDAIQIHGDAGDIAIRRNRILRGWLGGTQGQGLKLETYRGQSLRNVTLVNNLIVTGKPMIIAGVHGLEIMNNTLLGPDGIDLSPRYGLTINAMCNNIIERLVILDDKPDGDCIRIVAHGNNIFGSRPNRPRRAAYPFRINRTEAVAGNLNAIFTDPGRNRYTLAEGSPAVDFGSLACGPKTDIDGNPRLGPPDAGCYERSASRQDD